MMLTHGVPWGPETRTLYEMLSVPWLLGHYRLWLVDSLTLNLPGKHCLVWLV